MNSKESEDIRYGLQAIGSGLQALGACICIGLIVAALILKMH
jgi:hypothetical protein